MGYEFKPPQKIFATVIVGPRESLHRFIGLSWSAALDLARNGGGANRGQR